MSIIPTKSSKCSPLLFLAGIPFQALFVSFCTLFIDSEEEGATEMSIGDSKALTVHECL